MPGDSEFCFRLHEAAMGGYVAAVWGWDEKAQREFHERAFTPGRWRIVTVDGVDAGMIDVEYGADEIYLSRIEIHPDHQGLGIGSRLIEGLLARGVPVVLDVLAVNERAYALYRRLGFREVGRHGDGERKIRMRYG